MKTTKSILSLVSRLLSYGLVAVAANAVSHASADLVVHDGGDFRSNTIFFDMESSTVQGEHFNGADFELWPGDVDWPRIRGYGSSTTQGAVMIESAFGIPTTVRRLSEGDTVDASGPWGGYDDWQNPGEGWETSATFLTFSHGERGYVGLRLTNKANGTYFYGWADITYHNEGSGIFTLHRWAIQTEAGQPVVILPPGLPLETPLLQIEWDEDRPLISWPAPSDGWVLESSDDLASWEPTEGVPQVVGERMQWRDPQEYSRRFYRLMR